MFTIGTKVNGRPAWLGDPAARCWEQLERQGMPDDGINDAGRTSAEQQQMRDDYLAGKLPATAAAPGTSDHEERPPEGARAVDAIGDTQSWLIAHAPACWSRPLLKAPKPERWHWVHNAGLCHNQATTSPTTPTTEDDDMRDLFASLYRTRAGRPGTDDELDGWTIRAARGGWSAPLAVQVFEQSPAEPSTVRAAFRAILEREAEPEAVTYWAAGRSIGDVWAAVAVEKAHGAI